MGDKSYSDIVFEKLYENANDAAILIMDKEGTILNSNRGIERSYGYPEKELIGKNFEMLFTEKDRLKNMPQIEIINCLQKGFGMDRNFVVHKDGSHIWSHGETIFTETRDGEIRLVKLIYDINEQKLLEYSLVKANQELKESRDQTFHINQELSKKNSELDALNKELDTFAYTASHDLKAPINNIEALVSVIKDELSEDSLEKVKGEMELLSESIEKFKSVINDLTQTVKEEEHKATKEVHFIDTLESVKASLRDEIESSKAILTEDFGQVPSINFSKKNLRSILYNLISNAIKYRSPDRRPEIGLYTSKKDKFTQIKVTDNGLGMKTEEKDSIFDAYKRLHNNIEGTGIGLNIVKKIVDNNGGRIEVESEEGKGSIFRVFLKA